MRNVRINTGPPRSLRAGRASAWTALLGSLLLAGCPSATNDPTVDPEPDLSAWPEGSLDRLPDGVGVSEGAVCIGFSNLSPEAKDARPRLADFLGVLQLDEGGRVLSHYRSHDWENQSSPFGARTLLPGVLPRPTDLAPDEIVGAMLTTVSYEGTGARYLAQRYDEGRWFDVERTSYRVDGDGRLVESDRAIFGSPESVVRTYHYAADGRPARIEEDGDVVGSWTWDGDNATYSGIHPLPFQIALTCQQAWEGDRLVHQRCGDEPEFEFDVTHGADGVSSITLTQWDRGRILDRVNWMADPNFDAWTTWSVVDDDENGWIKHRTLVDGRVVAETSDSLQLGTPVPGSTFEVLTEWVCR